MKTSKISSVRQARINRSEPRGDTSELEVIERTVADTLRMYSDLLSRVDIEKINIASPNDIYKITNALSGLVKAQVELDRWKSERSGMIQEACELLTNDLQILVGNKPELMYELLQLLDNAAQRRIAQLPE